MLARPERLGVYQGSTLAELTQRYAFDGLVNNVGFVRLGKLGEIDLDDLENALSFNLRPAVQSVQAVLPGMRERGWGRVVNLSSLVVLGVAERSTYAAAKSAMCFLPLTKGSYRPKPIAQRDLQEPCLDGTGENCRSEPARDGLENAAGYLVCSVIVNDHHEQARSYRTVVRRGMFKH